MSELNAESEHLAEEIRDLQEKIERHRSYGIGNASQNEFVARRQELEEIMTDIEYT